MPKSFFISHAGPDKPFALELKEQLDGDAWVDLHEIGIGQVLMREIAAGIEQATDFVLLWSQHSAKSRWVEFELNMALIRHLRDETAMGLRVIALDDTPAPLHLEALLQLRPLEQPDGTKVPPTAGQARDALLRSTAAPDVRRSFVNRHAQIATLEESLYDPAVAAVWIHGFPGVGKRSLANEGLGRFVAGASAVVRIRVTAGTAASELFLLLAQARGEVAELPTLSPGELAQRNVDEVVRLFSSGELIVFEDAEHWLTDAGELGPTARTLVAGVGKASDDHTNRLMVFTSRRRAEADTDLRALVKPLRLDGLSATHSLPVLRAHGARDVAEAELREVATELGGHPLALEIVARRLPLPIRELHEQRTSIATDLIDRDRMSDETWHLLEALSLVDGPVSGVDLAEFLQVNAAQFQASVAQASDYSLVEASDFGSLVLHPLVRDYFLRSYRKDPGHSRDTERLARICQRRLDRTDPTDPEYVQTLVATVRTLGLAGRFEEAMSVYRGLTGTFYQTAEQLYQERRWDEALPYMEQALTGDDELDLDVLRLKSKTLAYLKRTREAREIADKLVNRFPRTASVMRDRGRIEFIDRNWETALDYFRRAIPLRRNPSQVWVDIAQCYVRLERWEDAAVAAKNAIDLDGGTPWALNLYSQALEKIGDFPEALEVITRAVRREPQNPMYRHRLGRIAAQTGDRTLALTEFRRSVELDPAQPDAWISLANALLDDQKVDEAVAALDSAAKLPGGHQAVVANVRARVALLTGSLSDAQEHVDTALQQRRDPQNLALAIRVAIARAEADELPKSRASAVAQSHAKELMGLQRLDLVVDLDAQYPSYFSLRNKA